MERVLITDQLLQMQSKKEEEREKAQRREETIEKTIFIAVALLEPTNWHFHTMAGSSLQFRIVSSQSIKYFFSSRTFFPPSVFQ